MKLKTLLSFALILGTASCAPSSSSRNKIVGNADLTESNVIDGEPIRRTGHAFIKHPQYNFTRVEWF